MQLADLGAARQRRLSPEGIFFCLKLLAGPNRSKSAIGPEKQRLGPENREVGSSPAGSVNNRGVAQGWRAIFRSDCDRIGSTGAHWVENYGLTGHATLDKKKLESLVFSRATRDSRLIARS
jgi:hypothetical protein